MSRVVRRPDSASWMIKATVASASVPLSITISAVTPNLGRIAAEFAHDAADAYLVKMIQGIVGVAMVLGAPIAGFLTDRYGRSPILLSAGLLFASAGVAPFFLSDLQLILVTRFFVGLAAIAFATVGTTMVGEHFEESERPRWMGILVAGALLTNLLTVPLAGFIGDAGWRWPFLLYAIGFPIALIGWIGSRRVKTVSDALAASHIAPPALSSGQFPLGLVALGLFVGFFLYTPSIYAPFQLQKLGIQNPSEIGMCLTVSALVALIVVSQFGRARQLASSGVLFCWSFGSYALGMAVFATASSYPLALAGLFFIGFGIAWLPANLMALTIAAVDESYRGRAVGWVRGAQSIAVAVGVTVLAPLELWFGVRGVLILIAGTAALLLAVMARRAVFQSQPALA